MSSSLVEFNGMIPDGLKGANRAEAARLVNQRGGNEGERWGDRLSRSLEDWGLGPSYDYV